MYKYKCKCMAVHIFRRLASEHSCFCNVNGVKSNMAPVHENPRQPIAFTQSMQYETCFVIRYVIYWFKQIHGLK